MKQDPVLPHSDPMEASGPDADREELRAWLSGWGAEVASVRLDAGRRRFSPDVSAFGTRADVVIGLDRLFEDQWSKVWPTIEEFRFEADDAQVIVSPDRLLAVIVSPWNSTGIAEDGTRFDRPGRATVALSRATVEDPWLGVHTHFSLGFGVPSRSYGSRTPQSEPSEPSDG